MTDNTVQEAFLLAALFTAIANPLSASSKIIEPLMDSKGEWGVFFAK